MTIPAHANFSIKSSFPLQIGYPNQASFTLTLDAPTHLASTQPILVIPAGVLCAGFARGWRSLPAELKLEILRHGLLRDSPIWPANANQALHDSLFPYMRMSPEIAVLARKVYLEENVFVLLAFQENLAMFRDWPPMLVRPLIRNVALMTWLDPGDSATIEAIAEKRFGFENLAYIEVRCSAVNFVRSSFPSLGVTADRKAGVWSTQLSLRLPPKIRFEPKGVVAFDRPRVGGADVQLMKLLDLVESLVRERFEFGVSPSA